MQNSSRSMRPLRIAYLAVEAPRQGHATYAHVHEIVGGLRRRGIRVDLFQPRYASRAARPGLVRRWLEQLRIQLALFARWRRYDAVYVRAHYSAFPTTLLARITGRSVIEELNGPSADVFIAHPWTRRIGFLLRWLYRTQLAWADGVITVTPLLRSWVEQHIGRRDVDVIPNAANLELFSPSRQARAMLPEKFVVFFGALTPWQGLQTLIAAFDHLDWPASVDLVIVGDGQLRELVAATAARQPRLHLIDRVPYEEVGSIVAHAIAGLVPKNGRGNRHETGLFPVKLFEILACSVPAVVTDFPGQADLVRQHDCGIVVPPEDPPALARAVATLAGSPSQSRLMGLRGHEAIVAEHSWSHRAADTARVLERVAGKRRSMPASRVAT